MAPIIWLLTATLVGPADDNLAQSVARDMAVRHESELGYSSVHEAREALADVLRASNLLGDRTTRDAIAPTVSMYRRISRSESLTPTERRLLERRLRARLLERLETLRRRERRGAAHSGGTAADLQELINLIETTIAPDTWEFNGRGTLAGGATGGAGELIDLIQTTVEPETWEINGGRGSIFYFPNR